MLVSTDRVNYTCILRPELLLLNLDFQFEITINLKRKIFVVYENI